MSLRLNQILGGADIRSPIFYDSTNTAYYIDASHTSNLLGLTVANTITGSVSGNAGTATTLQTARTINGTSFNGSANITTSSWGTARTLTIGSTGKSVDGSANISWSLAELGAAATNQTMFIGTTSVAINRASASQTLTGVSIDGNSATTTLATKATRANGDFFIDDNYGNSVVGLYSANRYQGVFAMGNAYKLAADGTGVGTLYGIAWSHPNAGGVAANLNDHGALILLNGTYAAAISSSIRCATDMRTPIYYDSNNTAYYTDPASTSNLNNLTVAGTMTFGTLAYVTESRRSKNSSNVDIETVTGLVSPSGPTFFEIRGFCPPTMYRTTGDRPAPYGLGFGNGLESGGIMPIGSGDNLQEIMLYGANSGPTTFTFKRQIYEGTTYDPSASNYYGSSVFSINTGTGAVTASTDIRSPIYYDQNDTTYYIDAASTSQLNQVASYYLRNLAAVSTDHQFGLYFNNSIDTAYAIYREGGAWTNPYPDLRIAFHTGIKIGANAGYNGIRFYDDYGMANQVMSVNNSSDGLGANNVYVNNSLQAGSSLRAPIFYDSDNTGYYLNPASTTNLNDLYLDGDLRMNGSDSYIWMPNNNSYSTGFYDPVTGLTPLQLSGPSDGIYIGNTMWISYNKANNNSYNENIRLFNANNSVSVIAFSSTGISGTPTTSILGYSDRFETRVSDQWQQRIYSGYVEAYGSFRAPIFYDSNNTSYYTDPASTSVLNRIDLPSGSAAINTTTPGQTVYQLNFTGQSTVDNAQAITWGWSTSGAQAGIYVQSSGAYGTKMYIATTDSFATGSKTAITIDHTGIVTTNRNYLQAAGSLRAPIFYDSDNTAYYLDPVGTSRLTNLNVNEYYAIGWFRNSSSGNGLYNESSTQHFYSDDVSYWNVASSANAQGIRLRTGGYNGAIRGYFYADNNNDVGLLNNGGNWRVRVVGGDYLQADGSSIRGQIFYDSNDTNYYINPGSTTISSNLRASQFINAFKTFVVDTLTASGTQARTFEIARIGIDYNDWNQVGTFEVELHERYYSRGLKKVYNIWYGYVSSSGIRLVEWRGDGDNNFQCRIGSQVLVTGDQYYLPVFIDVRNYAYVDVVIKTNRNITTNTSPEIGYTYINISPSATNISDFTADSDLELTTRSTAKLGGNVILTSANYNSYSPTLTGGGASGSWGINITGSSASSTGNAATATTLQTARNINGTSFNGSANITTASWGTARTITIGATGKSVDGSANASWSLAEITGSQTANTFLAAPNGSAGNPTFRAIVAADIPTLNQNTTGTAANVTGTVSIANGGTGATTIATAAANLGLGTSSTPKFINVYGERTSVTASASTTVNTQFNVTELTMSASITTLTLSNIQANNIVHMWTIVTVGNGTAYSITWPAAIKWPGGTAPTLTTTSNKRDIYQFVTYDGGTTIYAIIVGQNL